MGLIHVVRTQNFPNNSHFLPTCAYQGKILRTYKMDDPMLTRRIVGHVIKNKDKRQKCDI